MKKFLSAVYLFFLIIANCDASEYGFQNILISDPWARPTLNKFENSAIYMDITNSGAHNDNLIKAETEIAQKIEIHKTVTIDKVSSMVHVDKVMIPSNTKVKFAPKGLHIMIMGVKKTLREHDKFPLILTFEKAGKINIEVVVSKQPKINEN